jgi:translation initiation factor IF-3
VRASASGTLRRAGQPEVPAISAPRLPEVRVNERIRVPQVRVIGDDGAQVGVLPVREALMLAQSKGLDLVEVSPTARPPVCRIMDYGKFKYEQNRRARKARKKQHQMQLKEIKMRPKIEGHDYNFKLQHAREFLEGRDKVKLTVTFRGREIAHQDIGHRLIQKVIAALSDISTVESSPRSEGRTLTSVLMPKQKSTAPKPESRDNAPAAVPAAVPVARKPTPAPRVQSGSKE